MLVRLLLAAAVASALVPSVHAQGRYSGLTCKELWHERNAILARNGYCFKTRKAQAVFGKGCFAPFGKLSKAEEQEVQRIKSLEASKRCPTSAAASKADWRGLMERPVVVGGDPDFDACGSSGEVVGLDPSGDGFLSVRSRPDGKEIDRLFNGQFVYVCEDSGSWFGVVYPEPGHSPEECNVSTPWHTRMPYTRPCRYGWVFSKYVRVIAG